MSVAVDPSPEGAVLCEVSGVRLWCRPQTSDLSTAKTIIGGRTYDKHVTFHPNDRWLDVGAHIGTFAIATASRVHCVACYEPDGPNFQLLQMNVDLNSLTNVAVHNSAISARPSGTVPFYLNRRKGKDWHSLYPRRGRELTTTQNTEINEVLAAGHFNKIKLDCEAAEYDIIVGMEESWWDSVEEIVLEYHLAMHEHEPRRYYEVVTTLQDHFSSVTWKPLEDLGWNHATIISARK